MDLLIEALNKYEGSIVLVSHDRYFIIQTANKIWEIEDHKIREFKGGYEEWVDWKERMQKHEAEAKKLEAKNTKTEVEAKSQPNKEVKKNNNTSNNNSAAQASKETQKELQKQQRLIQQLEEKITTLTKNKTELEAAMADPANYADKSKYLKVETDYKTTNQELSRLNKQYEETFEKIIALESTAG